MILYKSESASASSEARMLQMLNLLSHTCEWKRAGWLSGSERTTDISISKEGKEGNRSNSPHRRLTGER